MMIQCESRSGARWFFIEERAFDAAEKWYTQSGHATFRSKKSCDDVWVDGGGSVIIDEPKISVEANGCKFGTFLRHVAFVIENLKSRSDKDIPGHIKFGSWPASVIVVTTETRDALVEQFEKVWTERGQEAMEVEDKRINVLKEAGVVNMGLCACQSGQRYEVCCGRRN